MPNYRRLISYIYAYEGAVKGKNIGFAKIETRGAQCKITVSVKRIYVGGNDIGVYLLAADQEIFLGNIFIRGGSGEFRTVVSASDVEHSGINVDQCFGLTIHDVKNTWRSYTTIWEDAVAHAAEVYLSNNAAQEKGQTVVSEEQIKRAVREIEEEFPLESQAPERTVQADALKEQEQSDEGQLEAENLQAENQRQSNADMDSSVTHVEELVNAEPVEGEPERILSDLENAGEEDLQCTEERKAEPAEAEYVETEHVETEHVEAEHVEAEHVETEHVEVEAEHVETGAEYTETGAQQAEQETWESVGAQQQEAWNNGEEPMEWQQNTVYPEAEPVSGNWQNSGQEGIISEMQEKKEEQEPTDAMDFMEREAVFSEPYPCSSQEAARDTISYRADAVINKNKANQEAQPKLGNPAVLERLLQKENQEENSHERVWEKLKREHTRILAFDYEDGCEILTIKPQDIGLLPRDAWVYGNNSFLLHGYYNYRYLILAKLFNPNGMPRYLLGVPGHYYSNERYMASMFGFPNFVLSKDQPMEDGRFGFWYTDVKLGG